ncbi:MAG: PrgI family protein [Clostridiales bacterium]|nr:PrgI family protein [Clostridiales bacterium]
MAFVTVPKDLSKVKSKVAFNLTSRQIVCFSLAAVVGIPFYILTRKALGSTISAVIMIFIMLPFFFLAMYEKDGLPFEKIMMNFIRFARSDQIRTYQTENLYRQLESLPDPERKEEKSIERKEKRKQKKHT